LNHLLGDGTESNHLPSVSLSGLLKELRQS
jgi:hypothetical protein